MRVPSDGRVGDWLLRHVAPVRWLQSLGQISYSVFLVHFPLCLLVNATITTLFPANPVINALGMLLAVAVSIAGGHQFHRRIESHPFKTRTRLLFPAGVVEAAAHHRRSLKNPPKTADEYLETLQAQGLTQSVAMMRQWIVAM